jgi:hypothetical protein
MANNIIDELLEEAAVLMEDWEARRLAIPWWHPRMESGSSGSGGATETGDSGNDDDAGSSGDNDDDNDDATTDDGGTIDWKKMARRHERDAKRERKARETAEQRVKDRDTADQSEHEKAVQKAREEGEQSARKANEKERRGDRLENAAIKLAGKGIKVKVGEEEQTLKFTDPDDAFVYIERMIRNGDLDEDDLFDDKGKVKADALKEALEELVDAKPHLVAVGGNGGGSGGGNGSRKVHGSADGGKGAGGTKSVDDLTTEEHFQRIKQHT